VASFEFRVSSYVGWAPPTLNFFLPYFSFPSSCLGTDILTQALLGDFLFCQAGAWQKKGVPKLELGNQAQIF
jgi:hypothetical protein